MTVTLQLNGERVAFDADPQTPLLWVLRDSAFLTGTKFGCGIAACGACTVHLNGAAVRSCVIPLQAASGAEVVTIEGLPKAAGLPRDTLHPLQSAWIAAQVPQCGYCQSGMIMAAAALLKAKPVPTDADIDAAMTNICRCGTYPRVRAAIHSAATAMATAAPAPTSTQGVAS
ncbi:(2Fe-2S)-binding protein [Ramlibacter sp.]|uniref:(2Fe-2S)-binding protein n=1 Tax=Ramlibacter sp. TaxID=1917967 RepID=UPI003D13221A